MDVCTAFDQIETGNSLEIRAQSKPQKSILLRIGLARGTFCNIQSDGGCSPLDLAGQVEPFTFRESLAQFIYRIDISQCQLVDLQLLKFVLFHEHSLVLRPQCFLRFLGLLYSC